LTRIPAGKYTLKYQKAGYITNERNVTVTTDIDVGSVLDMSMSPNMRDDEWRAVLKWGETPKDLDTYAKWGWSKVWWGRKNVFASTIGAVLEQDRTKGFGPETLYFSNVGNCEGGKALCDIRYFVNDKVGKMYDAGEARVTVYTGERVAGSFQIKNCESSVSKDGQWWHVFTIDAKTNKLRWNCENPGRRASSGQN
jgi:hypothetical protein